ncbi:phospholipase A1 PLIP1, chloroplastic [Silene latifolia]|uniref:phospholipase A1 PLIP1, chloroplastic n=1 Tax=Silene latifolia TaxID=37657 RepID=UPI003D786C6A
MACSSMTMSASHIVTARKGILGDNCGLRRSSSGEELCKQATLKKSFSDNNLLHSSSPNQTPKLLRASSGSRSSLLKPSHSFGIFSNHSSTPVLSKDVETVTSVVDGDIGDEETEGKEEKDDQRVKKANWMTRLLELRTLWKGRQEKEVTCENPEEGGECEDGCLVDYAQRFDAVSFSRFLVEASWSDAKRFSKLAYLCHMAYTISKFEGNDVLLDQSLRMITSSLEKKAEATAVKARLERDATDLQGENSATLEPSSKRRATKQEHTIRNSVAYEIAASAASHVQSNSCTCGEVSLSRAYSSERAAQMAASTMTAVVAAREREKQQVAKELQSLHSSPCEWFICDDPATRIRYFVIQGSESLASWQANLFFEPTKFEETDALVHRGIYEAAKGIYKQFLPEIENHIRTHGEHAKLQFTGHSLGGSLSLLVHIMLISSRTVKPSTLLPVVTFGSPFIFCGGDKILDQLGLDKSMLQSVILHRDIVPRAFSCNYPKQVAQVLKRLNGSFRSHPCLNKHKMLYSPVGQTFIIQPREKLSPSHPMLPPGCGLYTFDNTRHETAMIAFRTFLNTPHPLETLSDPKAYGSEGTIIRDHDSNNYKTAVSDVLRQYRKFAFRKVRQERHLVWPLIATSLHQAWTHKGNFENRSAREEVMSSV